MANECSLRMFPEYNMRIIVVLLVADGQRLYSCMHGHLRLEQVTLKREKKTHTNELRQCLGVESVAEVVR